MKYPEFNTVPLNPRKVFSGVCVDSWEFLSDLELAISTLASNLVLISRFILLVPRPFPSPLHVFQGIYMR